MSTSKSQILRILPFLLIPGFFSCEEPGESLADNRSYFPVDDNLEWKYQRWIANGDDAPGQLFDTLILTVGNEVIVEGKNYREILDPHGTVDRIVRTEGSKYYARNHELYQSDFSHEYVFLDTEKAAGDSWFYIKDEGYSKTEYVIRGKNTTQVVGGTEYKDVIEVKVNYYHLTTDGDFEQWASVIHYYAKGVGEIYHFYPYPTLMFGDVSSFLVSDTN